MKLILDYLHEPVHMLYFCGCIILPFQIITCVNQSGTFTLVATNIVDMDRGNTGLCTCTYCYCIIDTG